jgi:hypothetical protein
MWSNKHLASGFNYSKAEAFAVELLNALNNKSVCAMLSAGNRTGLFDVMKASPPSTPEEIAAEACLSERYVRNWLGKMVDARVVEIDPKTRKFLLPAEHAALLTRIDGDQTFGAAMPTTWLYLASIFEDLSVE